MGQQYSVPNGGAGWYVGVNPSAAQVARGADCRSCGQAATWCACGVSPRHIHNLPAAMGDITNRHLDTAPIAPISRQPSVPWGTPSKGDFSSTINCADCGQGSIWCVCAVSADRSAEQVAPETPGGPGLRTAARTGASFVKTPNSVDLDGQQMADLSYGSPAGSVQQSPVSVSAEPSIQGTSSAASSGSGVLSALRGNSKTHPDMLRNRQFINKFTQLRDTLQATSSFTSGEGSPLLHSTSSAASVPDQTTDHLRASGERTTHDLSKVDSRLLYFLLGAGAMGWALSLG